MRTDPQRIRPGKTKTAQTVRARIEAGGERLWRLADFGGLPLTAVASTLARLSRQGVIERLRKGLYYRPRHATLGPSRANLVHLQTLMLRRKGVFRAGTAAANLLGFTTQNPSPTELATADASLPRLVPGEDAVVHARRPPAWQTLSEMDAALLDFLRNRGVSSELPPEVTVEKLLEYFREPGRFERLLKVAHTEPPRVRAMLGAIGEQIGQPDSGVAQLRDSLNPLSRFNFGILAVLACARQWQAKECQDHRKNQIRE